MTHQNIGYHTRLYSDNAVKVVGGSFGGDLSMETANRLVNAHGFKVVIKPSGTPVFVDKQGREVRLYISVDPDKTDIGIAALKQWRIDKARQEAEYEAQRKREESELEDAMNGLTHEEIMRRLKGDAA